MGISDLTHYTRIQETRVTAKLLHFSRKVVFGLGGGIYVLGNILISLCACQPSCGSEVPGADAGSFGWQLDKPKVMPVKISVEKGIGIES